MDQKKRPFPIWTDKDRLCGQCNSHLALPDDWLCQRCRDALEITWSRLLNSSAMYQTTEQRESESYPHVHTS